MDFSKFKFELYDFLALLLPGFLALCIGWVLLRGWHTFVVSLSALSGSGFTALLLVSFPVGHLIQELGDAAMKKVRGERFFKSGRDKFWDTEEGRNLKAFLTNEIGFEPTADGAFDFCLHRIKNHFAIRHAFLTTSDLCRSLLVLGLLVVPAAIRVLWDTHATGLRMTGYIAGSGLIWLGFLYLADRRMTRFRERSDSPVFRTYLAMARSAREGGHVVELRAQSGTEE